jgi:hypothetical protein
LAPLRSQAIQNRGYPNLDSDYGSTSHPALPPRRGDHWSPPATTPPRFPSPPTAPSLSNRKRAREDNSWSPDLQSHPPYRPRYDDSERDHMGRVGSRNDSRGYRPVRTPSTHWTEINSSAYVNSDTGTSLIPEDQFSNRTAFYYQDAAQSTSGISAAQAQPGYSQRNQPLTTYWPTEAHKVHDKTDLLSRLSDLPRPPPIGPAKTTNHKRAPGRDYPQYRGAPPKSRGRGNNSLMSRLNLRS